MKIIKVKGNNYEIGFKLGRLFSKAIKYRINQFKINKKFLKNKKNYLKRTEKIFQKYPKFYNELKGISFVYKTSFYEILMLNLLGLLDINRCSSLTIKKKNNIILAHNKDGDKFERKKDFALIKYENKNFYFYSYFYPGELLGSTFGWNSYGLIITVNSIRSNYQQNQNYQEFFYLGSY